jgi:hypothetical protein
MMSQACSWRSNILKFGEQFLLEFTVRFELSVPKGGFSWALEGLVGSSKRFNFIFLNPPST